MFTFLQLLFSSTFTTKNPENYLAIFIFIYFFKKLPRFTLDAKLLRGKLFFSLVNKNKYLISYNFYVNNSAEPLQEIVPKF